MGSFHMRLKDLFCIEEPSLLWMDLLEIKSLSLLIHQIHIIFLKIKTSGTCLHLPLLSGLQDNYTVDLTLCLQLIFFTLFLLVYTKKFYLLPPCILDYGEFIDDSAFTC